LPKPIIARTNPDSDIKYSKPPILESGSTAIIPPNKVIVMPEAITLKLRYPFLKLQQFELLINLI